MTRTTAIVASSAWCPLEKLSIDLKIRSTRFLAFCGALRSPEDCFQQPLNSSFLPVLIRCFDDSIRAGDDQVTGLQLYDSRLIDRIREHPDWSTTGLEPLDGAVISQNERWIMSRIDVSERSCRSVEDAIEQSRVSVRPRGSVRLVIYRLEIANAFLVPDTTMAQRISRAKQTIKTSGAPFRLPPARERAERLPAVLHVLYLIFSEGYTSSIGSHLQRFDLVREAIRLTRNTKTLLPDNTEVAGLLALMLLTDARRAARTGPDEELIPLDKQDRSLWDRAEISEGIELLAAALAKGSVGLYQLQAAIAAVHDEAERAEDTD